MKKTIPFLTLILGLTLLGSCSVSTNNSTAGSSNSSQESNNQSSSTSISNTTSNDSNSSTNTSTTIEPDDIPDDYEDQNYSFSYIEDYSTLLTSSIESLKDNVEYSSLEPVAETSLTITEAGDYYFEGNSYKSITLALNTAGEVHLFFNNATFSGAKKAISSDDGDLTTNLFITLIEGSENSISTTKNSIDVTSNVIINGQGTLNVTSSGKSCIKSSKTIYIFDALLNLNAQASEDGHGVSAETIYALDTTINVLDCGKDGLHAEINDVGLTSYVNSAGFIYLNDTTFTYEGEGDGIQADSFVYSYNSTLTINTNPHFVLYGSEEATTYEITDSDDFKFKKDSSNNYYKIDSEQRGQSNTYALANSVKGIKVGEIDQEETVNETTVTTDIDSEFYECIIDSSTLTFDTADDSIHVNQGSLKVNNSSITASSLDQPLCSDGPLTINDSTINILESYEGIQGSSIHINGEQTNITINSSDDGMNASSDYYTSANDSFYRLQLNINAGNIKVVANGDGLDSNGSLNINGGNVYVEGSSSGGDSPLDSAMQNENSQDYGITINGGNVISTGSNGMLESPLNTSKQYVIVYSGNQFSSSSKITVKDSSSTNLLETTITNSGQAIILSSPSFILNGTYSIYINDTKVQDVTITDTITTSGNVSAGPNQNPFSPDGGGHGGRH